MCFKVLAQVCYHVDALALSKAILPYCGACKVCSPMPPEFIMDEEHMKNLPSDLESFVFCSALSTTTEELNWSDFQKLRTIRICPGAMSCTNRILVHDLPQLTSFIVETNAFASSKEKEQECRIVDCPMLSTLSLQRNSFNNYSLLELRNLPSLVSFDLDSSFTRGKVLLLHGLLYRMIVTARPPETEFTLIDR